MNAFCEHHQHNISFRYDCFDRILLNAIIQPFQQEERVVGFFNTYRNLYPVSRSVLRDISTQYHNWAKNRSTAWDAPILDPPDERRDQFVEPYFDDAQPDEVVCIIKAREPARIMTAIGKDDRWHLELKNRWVDQYSFYLNDCEWGRMFVRVCPYFPFSARICLNQHYWLAQRLRERGIRFRLDGNAFLSCADPGALQALADSLTAQDLIRCGQKWLAQLTSFFTERERRTAGVQHRLFFSQVEYCNNIVFKRRAALDELGERLLDANRTIGRPNKLTVIYGRRITRRYNGKLQTEIEDLNLPNPVMRSHYKHGFIKQYVRGDSADSMIRTEAGSNDVRDFGVLKSVDHLPVLRENLYQITETYLDIQQDILETFVDRGYMQKLSEPTILPSGKRIPGLKLDHPRQLALMNALVRFSHIVANRTFTTRDIHDDTAKALGPEATRYSLGSLRYDLSKLIAKRLVRKLPRSHSYELTSQGYKVCLIYIKLSNRICKPLVSGILKPFKGDNQIAESRLTKLDNLYRAVNVALDQLVDAVGLKAA